MVIPTSVSRWEPIVRAELGSQSVPLPHELILAVIKVESSGKPGLVNNKSGASGLMQIMPTTLQDFNSRHGTNYTMADMQSESDSAARKQIQVGIGVLAHYWKRAFKYLSNRLSDVPIDELAHIADLFYTAGPGATMKKLDKLSSPTWAAVQAAYPSWNALPHPRKVLKEPKPWDMDRISAWLEGPLKKIVKDPRKGFALGILMLMLAYWLMKGQGK
jgi:soluble lytic murein transglycosylase-like protein